MMAVWWSMLLSGCGKLSPLAREPDACPAKAVSFHLESAMELLDSYRADMQTCWTLEEKNLSADTFSRQLSSVQSEKLQEALDILVPGKTALQQTYLQENAANRLLALRLTFHLSGAASQVESHLLAAEAALSEMKSSESSRILRDMHTAGIDYFSCCENPGESCVEFSEKIEEIAQTIQRCRVQLCQ